MVSSEDPLQGTDSKLLFSVKEEEVEQETGAFGWTEDAYEEFRRASQEAREGLREAARKLAADAGLSSFPARPEREPAARELFQKRRGHVSTGGGAKTHFPLEADVIEASRTAVVVGRLGSGPPVGPISPAVCAVEPEVSDTLPVTSVTFPRTYVPQAAQAQSRRLEGGVSPPTPKARTLQELQANRDLQ
ncbi:unnamed protein product [Gadus morhua 'NCC']